MANNMENFDFGALDSAAFDETMSFLNNYDPTLLPDPSSAGFGAFGEPVMDYWPAVEDPTAWNMLGNEGLSGGVPGALTESRGPGFELASYELGSGGHQSELHQVVGTEIVLGHSESGFRQQRFQQSNNTFTNLDSLPNEMALPCFTCDWPLCTSRVFYGSDLELSYHKTDVHIAEILKGWPGSCSWPGCTSKIFFKTSKRLESHVYNIHITLLCCNEAQCDYKKPFERQADLERHIASRHLRGQKYKCRYPQCGYTTTFTRKDKLKLHYDSYHNDKFPCHFYHCVHGFPSKDAQKRHSAEWWSHGLSYWIECGIGSCRLTSKSSFKDIFLRQHLECDHKISTDVAMQAMASFGLTPYLQKTLTLTHLPPGFSEFKDCDSSVQKLKENASSEGMEQHQ